MPIQKQYSVVEQQFSGPIVARPAEEGATNQGGENGWLPKSELAGGAT
jgi:hypothetical protein